MFRIETGCTFVSAKAIKLERKTKAMTDQKQLAEEFFKKVKGIEPAIGGYIDEHLVIRGTYRGKKGNEYAYSFLAQRFLFNNAGSTVSGPFEKVILEYK